jgi:hypothetical protein
MQGWEREMQVAFLLQFFAYCYSERGGLAATTLQSCSSAVKRVLQDSGCNVEAFDDIHCRNARIGAAKMDAALFRTKKDKKLPVSGEMVRLMVQKLIIKGGQTGWMSAVAALFGFYSALRVCEYVQTEAAGGGHVIKARNVVFSLRGSTGQQWIPSHCMTLTHRRMVDSMQVSLGSAKNDQLAEGNSWIFNRGEGEHGVVFLEEMATWAAQAGSNADDPFISWRNKEGVLFKLKYRGYNKDIKEAAEACGFDPHNFGTHSLRIGSLSQMAAAGIPLEAVQQRAARHKNIASTAKYQSTSVKERDSIVRALAEDIHFSNTDVAAAAQTRGRGDGAEKKAATGGKSRSGRGS